MFTGIIQHLGTIKKIESKKNLMVFSIDLGPLAKQVKLGDSVAINGVCLTVVLKQAQTVSFDLMKETIEVTSLRSLKKGDCVNIELALEAGARLGGHFVTGHVDEVASIQQISKEKNWVAFRIATSIANQQFFAPKGSVAVDGVSLTVGKVGKGYIEVYLIPYTLQMTNLGSKKPGDFVNIETDILAKYLFASKKNWQS